MSPEQEKLLQDTSKKLDMFLDVYYRTHFIDKDVFNNPVIINNDLLPGKNGLRIGKTTADRIGFYGVTPVDQPATISDPSGQANDLDSEARTAINTIIDRLQEIGLLA